MVYNFIYPYRYPSGVSSLFVRLGHAIAADQSVQVRLIDYRDGSMAAGIAPGSRVELVEFERDAAIAIGAGETVVMQAEVPNKLRRQLRIHPEARVLELQLHPYNFIPPLIPLIGHRDWWLRNPARYLRALELAYPGL